MSSFVILIIVVLAWWLFRRYFKNSYRAVTASPANGREFYSHIAGVTFANDDGVKRQALIAASCKTGQPLRLVPEPNNTHDANAIGIWSSAGQIGYIQGGRLADELANRLRNGVNVTAHVSEVTGGTKKIPVLGVNIKINIPN